MTRLNAMRALLALPTTDGYTRSHEVVHAADADKLRAVRIKVKRTSRRKATSSRLSWLTGVHERQGA